jgi:predicted anti-sigma-YlaC factor YlaD
MDCKSWQDRLDDFLSDRLPAAERRLVQEHLAVCSHCQDLLSAVRRNLAILSQPEQQNLTTEILARTSGPACGRAQQMLAEMVEGSLPASEAQLVRGHVEHCSECEELAVTLTWLLPELRQMGALEPDRAFTADVLRATRAIRRRSWRAWLPDLTAWWRRQIARPQFSLQAAYVGTMLLVLLFGTPISPFKQAPEKALEVVQTGPDLLTAALVLPASQWPAKAAELGHSIWNATGAHVARFVESRRDGLRERRERTGPALSSMRRHGNACLDALLSGDFMPALSHLGEMQNDLVEAWHRYRHGPQPGFAPADTLRGAEQRAHGP